MQGKHESSIFRGIDGCRAGWCVATLSGDQLTIDIARDVYAAINNFEDISMTLIDMPIGLQSESIGRDLEKFARQLLPGNQKSSLFTPPAFEALQADNYKDASCINQRITGKKISIQSWNISGKMRALNKLLAQKPALSKSLKESHPEICFKFLNHGTALVFKKNAPHQKGIKERLDILSNYFSQSTYSFDLARSNFSSSEIKNDDIVDAMCLAIVAKLGYFNGYSTIYGSVNKNFQGIEMSMNYYRP